jgi:uncharacterized protein YjbI with pentapeptide repeats
MTLVTQCRFRAKVGDYACPRAALDLHNVRLCVFHFLIISKEQTEHPSLKLSALLGSDWPENIRDGFLKLVQDNEDNPEIESHNYTGFWLPSIDLRAVTFSKPVLFREAVFLQETIFSETKFKQDVDFFRAAFKGPIDCLSAAFEGPTDFNQARFDDSTDFSDTLFADTVSFCQVIVGGDVEFLNDAFDDEADFSFMKILKDGGLTFGGVDLRKASFLNTNLEKVDFRDVKWFRASNERRHALWDEFRPVDSRESGRNYSGIAQNYRELVLNCERKRDFESAEDFHIGEMEIRRRLAEAEGTTAVGRWLSKRFNAYALYWRFSRYGTSYMVALVWLLVWVLLVFPLIFLFSGFDMLSPDTGKLVERISYQMQPDHTQVLHWLSDWFKAASFSLSVSTFQRSRLYEATGRLAMISLPIESVIVAGQSALLLFAIRRRFKR